MYYLEHKLRVKLRKKITRSKCGEHCNKIHEEDLIKEGLRGEILEPIIVTINPDDISTDEDDIIN